MKKLIAFFILLCGIQYGAAAQDSTKVKPVFGTPLFIDKKNLINDLQRVLSIGPSAKKDSVWGAFESNQRSLPDGQYEKLFELSKAMHQNGYVSNPHFESLLACLVHPKMSIENRDAFIAVMDTTVRKYPRYTGANFLSMVRDFFESQYLHRDRFTSLLAEGGEISFGHAYDEALAKKNSDAPDPNAAAEKRKEEWFSHLEEEKKKDEIVPVDTAVVTPPTEETPADDGGWSDGWSDGWGTGAEEVKSEEAKSEESGGWSDGWSDGWETGGDLETEEEIARKKKEEEELKKKEAEERKKKMAMAKPERPKLARIENRVDIMPEVKGPFITINNANFTILSRYDTFKIEGTSGSVMGKNKVFVGKGGKFDWSSAGMPAGEPYAVFNDYTFNVRSPQIQSNDVSLYYPAKIDSLVKGEFRYMSKPQTPYAPVEYPKFIAYNSDITVKNVAENIDFQGGFMIEGNRIYGKSIQGGPSSLIVNREGKKRFKATSSRGFLMLDSLIANPLASLTIYQGQDSLIHDAVQLKFNPKNGELKARQDRHAYKDAPYFHSFHKVEMHGDYLTWDIDTDSFNIRMLDSQTPLTVESMDYFDSPKFARAKGLYSFHPLVMAVGYARSIKSWGFYSADMARQNKLNPAVVKGAMISMAKQGLIEYDETTDWLEVTPKAVKYTNANLGRSDYDNILIYSHIPGKQNVTMRMAENEMVLSGVEGFMISDSMKVIVTPKNKEIILHENRNTEFTGKMKAGNFIFEGSGFMFKYDSFKVKMDDIDRMEFLVKDSVTGQLKPLPNAMVETEGVLFISDPKNKSGLKPAKDYPRFDTDHGGTFFFGGKEILEGAYKGDSSIFFDVPPFFIDSINSSDPSTINFEGTFHSGGIFPPFEEKLRVMPDRSFGFERGTPEEGYPIYQDKLRETATYYNKISLDNRGIRGDGRIEYLRGKFFSPDFIFYTDSVTTKVGVNGNISPGFYGHANYPMVNMPKYKMRWIVNYDSMMLSNPPDQKFTIYEEGTNFNGTLAMSPERLSGTGDLENSTSLTNSTNFFLGETSFISRNSTFKIKSDDPKKPALLGERVKVFYNQAKRYADITAEKDKDDVFSFPYLQYKTNLGFARWDFEKQEVDVKAEDNERQQYKFVSTNPTQLGLEFDATRAIYDIKDIKLNIEGVNGITVGNVRIVPNEGKVVVRENADMDVLHKATIEMNQFTKNHILTNAEVKIRSRRKFEGTADYAYLNEIGDTTVIEFDYFDIKLEYEKKKNRIDTTFTTIAEASVKEDNRMKLMPGILYQGKMRLHDSWPTPEFDGKVALNINREGNSWFAYKSNSKDTLAGIYIDENVKQYGFPSKLITGIYLERLNNNSLGKVYGSLLEFDKEHTNDYPLFIGKGKLIFDHNSQEYTVAPPEKLTGATLQGNKFTYHHGRRSVEFDGVFSLVEDLKSTVLKCSGVGNGNLDKREFFINAFMDFEFEYDPAAFNMMVEDMREEAQGANPSQSTLELKMAQFMDQKTLSNYRKFFATADAVPMSELFPTGIVLSDVSLQWSEEHKAFYSVGEIGISNIFKEDMDVRVQGHIEIPKYEDHNTVHIYFELKNGGHYYIKFSRNDIMVHSSNESFNNAIKAKASKSKVKLIEDEKDMQALSLFLVSYGEKYMGGEYVNKIKKQQEELLKKKEGEKPKEEETEDKKDGF